MDFSYCPNLEELILVDCGSLLDVHESIGNLERLVYLNLEDCKNLRMLPKNMCMLKSLETLILSGCSNLDEMTKKMESLKMLETDGIPRSELWHGRSSSILTYLPCYLVKLSLRSYNLSDDAFATDLSKLSTIRSLDLDSNPICSLPVFIKGLTKLEMLSFNYCRRLESLVGLPKTDAVFVLGCTSLKKVTYQSYGLRALTHSDENQNVIEGEYYDNLEQTGRVDVEMRKLFSSQNLEMRELSSLQNFKQVDWVWSPVQTEYNEFFRVKEFGVELVQEHQDKMSTQHNTTPDPNDPFVIGGDLSPLENVSGFYFFCWFSEAEMKNTDFCRPKWLNTLIMDSDREEQQNDLDHKIAAASARGNNCHVLGRGG
ncbi:unnamed protein product [Malus baccata var. baccata]